MILFPCTRFRNLPFKALTRLTVNGSLVQKKEIDLIVNETKAPLVINPIYLSTLRKSRASV